MDKLSVLQVTEAVKVINQSLVLVLERIAVEGEVSGYRVSQGRWVFFDLKDADSSIRCFTVVSDANIQIEDGMIIKIVARPNLHNKYGFSLVIESMMASGEGSLKRAFELTKKKLEKEGLFAKSRKRKLPNFPETIALITSYEAAAYTDITRLLSDRWPIAKVLHVDVRVQGDRASESIVHALGKVNNSSDIADLVIIARGGGSFEDLAAFNDERVVRAIVSSRIPTVVGVGHERDLTLADMAADVRATTPTNAAQISTPDKEVLLDRINAVPRQLIYTAKVHINSYEDQLNYAIRRIKITLNRTGDWIENISRSLIALNPRALFKKGYVVVRNEAGNLIVSVKDVKSGAILNTIFFDGEVKSEVFDDKKR